MKIAGWILLGIGAALSLMMLIGDFQKLRSHEPYVATGLWAPEMHVVLALLTGGGSWMAWGWIAGVSVLAGHAVLGMTVGTLMRR